VVVCFSRVSRGDWPHWRGPNHDGISSETGASLVFRGQPRVLWERTIGSAFSSFAAVGDRLYTCGTSDRKQKLLALDTGDGSVVWETTIEGELQERQGGDGCRATPSVDEGRVYILGAKGTLLCADAKIGEELWRQSFRHPPTWSYSGSVLIEGSLAVVSPGGEHGSLAAFDKATGKPAWKAGSDGAGYATPYPFTFDGRRYIAGFTATEAIVVEAESGRSVWTTPWKTSYDVNASTPIYHAGHLFLSSGYGTGCALFKLERKGDGLTGRQVWKSKVLRNKFETCVLYEGKLYGADEESLKCVDFASGKLLWQRERVGGGRSGRTRHGTVLIAGGKLLFLSEAGELLVGNALPKGFEPQAQATVLSGRCWTVPVLHEGRLYARNLEKVVCLDLRR
jgi:outer membrane protein assembly factor BamB